MAVQKKGISLTDEVVDIVENFPSRYHGEEQFSTKLQEIIMDYAVMIERTKKEVLAILTEKEMDYLRDLLNSSLVTVESFPLRTVLPASIKDGDIYEGLGEKWGVDPQQLAGKVRNMSEFQVYTICKMVDEYWKGQGNESTN